MLLRGLPLGAVLFVAIWMLLMALTYGVMRSKGDPGLKKTRLQRLGIATPLLFGVFALVMTRSPRVLLILAPILILIAFLSRRMTRVCAKCGAVQHPMSLTFQPVKYCTQCGASL